MILDQKYHFSNNCDFCLKNNNVESTKECFSQFFDSVKKTISSEITDGSSGHVTIF